MDKQELIKGILVFFSMTSIMFILGCTSQSVRSVNDSGWTSGGVDLVVNSNNQFAFDLYKMYNTDEENIFFSPYSISTAFAVLQEGARGETAEEIANVLGFPENESLRRSSFARIYNEINNPNKEYVLSTANGLWGQENYDFHGEFINNTREYYGADLTSVNFALDPEESCNTINNWVAVETNNKINEIVTPDMIDSLMRLIITNAIYFKGLWEIPFDVEDTKEVDFRVAALMNQLMTCSPEDLLSTRMRIHALKELKNIPKQVIERET